MVEIFFGRKKNWLKKCWSEKKLGRKKIWVKKNFGWKKSSVKTKFAPDSKSQMPKMTGKNVGQKKVWSKFFWAEKGFGFLGFWVYQNR